MRKIYALACLILFGSALSAQVNVNAVWTWVNGEKHLPMRPVIAGKNVSSPINNPGGRTDAVSWTDLNGNVWMFGGYGFGGNSFGFLNDLWKYDQAAKEWTWINGDNAVNSPGVYGVQWLAADNNKPGARRQAVTWIGNEGDLYLFGGQGYGASGYGKLNDLWKYNIPANQWTWIGGSDAVNVTGTFGVQGVEGGSNWPGSRSGATLWQDDNGNIWLFGGDGYAATATHGRLNDMWKFDPGAGLWTWIKGADTVNSPGDTNNPQARNAGNTAWKDNAGNLYLFGGVTGSNNYNPPCGGCPNYSLLEDLWRFNPNTNTWAFINNAPMSLRPTKRMHAMTWVDDNGIFWMFGGFGAMYSGSYLNELWKYDRLSNQWTQVKGNNSEYVFGVYGTMNVPAATNNRGGRAGGITWKDNSGKMYSFGGDFQEWWPVTYRNDIWAYDPVTNWYTWEKGDTISTVRKYFVTLGQPDARNTPGERRGAASWYDNNGNLWFMGGNKKDEDDIPVEFNLNDLWKYNISTGQWTCAKDYGGSNYSVMGTPNPAINPSGRESPATWTDNANNLWLFGGYTGQGYLNDLMKYDISSGLWTWVKGTSANSAPGFTNGTYGTQGVPGSANTPSTRFPGASWKDNAGNFWLFGGATQINFANDLWKYDLATNQWTWVNGDNTINQPGVYGTKGVAAPTNKPGARNASATWTDNNGNLWLFGGYYSSSRFNDLWKYNIATNQWTWMNGDNTTNNAGVYGTRGVAAASNKPGARLRAATWTDENGNLWMMGGQGYDEAGVFANLNDLWVYDPALNQWTWVKGDATVNNEGVYGTKNIGNIANKPGARYAAANWKDGAGNFWIYGGWGLAESGEDRLSDLWKITASLSAPLPVHFLEFNGRLVNNDAVLHWKAENEENALSYIVERSTDRIHYTIAGSLSANNRSGIQQYGFTDPNISLLGSSVVYYRLQQKDFDGKTVYSNIIALTIDRSFMVFLYPNPAIKTTNITITTDKAETINVRIINQFGAVVKQTQWNLERGSASKSFDLESLPPGVYYFDISGQTISRQIKFVKQ